MFVFAAIFFCPDTYVFSSDFWDIVESAQKTIEQKYPSEDSIARKLALKELEEIAGSDKTDEQKIAAINLRFSSNQPSAIQEEDQPKIIKRALSECIKAAEQGDVDAQVYLAKFGKY